MAETTPAGPATTAPGRRPPRHHAGVVVEPLVFGGDAAFAYVDGNTGQSLGLDAVLQRLRAARVVVIGEQHDQAPHHELQRRLVEIAAADGPGLVVGLEMLSWDKQPALDAFNSGAVDVAGLAAAADWKSTWGFDYGLYAPILAAAHDGGARVTALNAPRALVKALRLKGQDGLSDAERRLLPALDLGDDLHRAWFMTVMGGHEGLPHIEDFYLAQVLWDEAMADRAVQALAGGARQVLVLAGNGHIANGRGIPQRVERRQPGVVVLSIAPLVGIDGDNAPARLASAIAEGQGDILVVPAFAAVIDL